MVHKRCYVLLEKKNIMVKWSRKENLIAFVFGLLGVVVGAGLMYWGKLPDHTIDLLTFTESAFGIGMTIIALIATLGVIQLRAEIEGKFREREKDIEGLQADVNGLFPMLEEAQRRIKFQGAMML